MARTDCSPSVAIFAMDNVIASTSVIPEINNIEI
jgi:hypothetical protein